MGGTSQLWKPSVAGGVTGLYEGLVGRGVTGALEVLVCFVGLMTCLKTEALEVLAVVVLEVVDFEGLTLDNVGLEGTALPELVLGLDGVALDGVTLGLGDVFLVGCGFFGTTPWSDKAASDFVLVGLVLVVAGVVGFFLLSVPVIVFLEVFSGVDFVGVGLDGF